MVFRNRRKKIILHSLQIELIIALIGLIIGIAVILVGFLFLIFKNNIASLPISEETVRQILANSIWPVAIIAAVLFIISLWAVIIMSHKIYGPLYRLSMYIRKLSNGEVTDELKFRRGDAVDGLKEIYNELRQSLEKTLRYDYKEMINIFSELENILDKIYNKEIQNRELYNSLQTICGRIAKALDITSEAIEEEKKK